MVTNYTADPSWNGHTVDQEKIDPPSLIVRMVKAASPNIGIIGTSMEEADMHVIFAHRRVVICSDGMLSGRHPLASPASVVSSWARWPRLSSAGRPCRSS